ncbi:MAG: DUF58 domain-containing protein [Gammaproteobacteria bacterium]|nr:DUF58 domain-containing protein [Gammaproteobacteria bacterium]
MNYSTWCLWAEQIMLSGDVQSPAHGAYVELRDLISGRYPARALKLSRRKRALSVLAGPTKTNFRGRGIDFEEVRSYQSGDDIRTIDWRVTARTGDAHTKLFREERERPVLVVVDQRNSMFFGSSYCFKSVLAAHLASLIAWSALDNGDRVGGLVFSDAEHREIRPKRSRRNVLTLLSEVAAYNHALPRATPPVPDSFSQMLDKLRRIARPGSSLYLVSDFIGANSEAAREQLFELAKHTEMTALYCSDALENDLPRAGTYAVTDGSQRSELNTADRTLRARYAREQQDKQAAIASTMQRLGIPLLNAATDASPFRLLQTYYGEARR